MIGDGAVNRASRLWLARLATLVGCFSFSAAAHAQSDAEQRQQAREHFRLGNEAFARHDREAALAEYQKAYVLGKSFDIACNLGRVEYELELWPHAAEHLDECLENFSASLRTELRIAEEKLSALYDDVRTKVALLRIDVLPDRGAQVSVGERSVLGPWPAKVYVTPGEHVVSARLDGHAPASRTLLLAAGAEQVVQLALIREEQPKPAVATPSASSGAASGSTSTSTSTPSSGQVGSDSRSHNWVPAYILGGVTVASLATSFVFRGMASNDEEDADRLRKEAGDCRGSASASCQSLGEAVDAHNTNATVSNVTLAVAGVGAAATIGYVLYELFQPGSSERPVEATIGFNGAQGGLLLSGKF
jgi:hypothetical protein